MAGTTVRERKAALRACAHRPDGGHVGGFFASVGTAINLGLVNWNRRQGVDLATSLWGQLAPALGVVRFDVQGAEHLWSHRPAVFLFNHQRSFMDLLISFRLLEREFTIVAKKELAHLVVIGQLFRLADVAFVDRGNMARAIEALKPVVQKLRSGISVAVSPEGTGSLTPRVGPFKKGAFHMAMEAAVPIVACRGPQCGRAHVARLADRAVRNR
jgi:putative phosphoserine phosphatase/1-acylglycerol-3-phosphate O-acyltransferase